MEENIVRALTALAQKLGTTTEYLWGVLVKQGSGSACRRKCNNCARVPPATPVAPACAANSAPPYSPAMPVFPCSKPGRSCKKDRASYANQGVRPTCSSCLMSRGIAQSKRPVKQATRRFEPLACACCRRKPLDNHWGM